MHKENCFFLSYNKNWHHTVCKITCMMPIERYVVYKVSLRSAPNLIGCDF